MSEVNNNEISGEKADVKKFQVKFKKSGLSDFLVKIKSDGGVMTGGELISISTKESYEFEDINDMLRLIEKQCNAVAYPQSQRKLRDWETHDWHVYETNDWRTY